MRGVYLALPPQHWGTELTPKCSGLRWGWVWAHFLSNVTDLKTWTLVSLFLLQAQGRCMVHVPLSEAFPPPESRCPLPCNISSSQAPQLLAYSQVGLLMTLSHTQCWAIIKKPKEGDSDMMCSVTFKTVRWLINKWRKKMWWICLILAALVTSCDTQITSETTLWSQSPDRSVVTPWLGKHHVKGMSAPHWSEMEPSGCKTPVPTFFFFFFFQISMWRTKCPAAVRFAFIDPV